MQVTCMLTLEDVEEAFFDCNKQKRNKDAAVEYYKDYEANNFQLWLDLRNMTYRIGKSIAFCVIYPTLREVMAAEYRDRIVHHILALKFEPFFERMMIDTSFGCRKGKGTLLGVTTAYRQMQEVSNGFTEDAWVLKCDIKSYYMSIDRQILMEMVERVVVDDYGGEDADWWLWLWRKSYSTDQNSTVRYTETLDCSRCLKKASQCSAQTERNACQSGTTQADCSQTYIYASSTNT